MSLLICSSFFCSSRSLTNSRTLPAWPRSPDSPGRLAIAATADRLIPAGDHSAAYDRPSSPLQIRDPTPPPRATKKKTPLSDDAENILAPMGVRRDDGGDQ